LDLHYKILINEANKITFYSSNLNKIYLKLKNFRILYFKDKALIFSYILI